MLYIYLFFVSLPSSFIYGVCALGCCFCFHGLVVLEALGSASMIFSCPPRPRTQAADWQSRIIIMPGTVFVV